MSKSLMRLRGEFSFKNSDQLLIVSFLLPNIHNITKMIIKVQLFLPPLHRQYTAVSVVQPEDPTISTHISVLWYPSLKIPAIPKYFPNCKYLHILMQSGACSSDLAMAFIIKTHLRIHNSNLFVCAYVASIEQTYICFVLNLCYLISFFILLNLFYIKFYVYTIFNFILFLYCNFRCCAVLSSQVNYS